MQNGRLPARELSRIPGGRLARRGPARSWLAMRFYIGKKTKIWLHPTGPVSSYRSIEAQQRFYAAYKAGRGPLAAYPGSSNHGWGRAVDVPTPAMAAQIRRYGHLFGWGIAGGRLASDAPSEWWHCTYRSYPARARFWFARYLVARRKK